DDVIIGIVKERLERPDATGGVVLDGFPRTVAQATVLDQIISGRGLLVVVDIVVPEVELVRRLASRLICEDCGTNAAGPAASGSGAEATRCAKCGGRLVQRADDNEGVVRERLKVYHAKTEPLIEFYRGRPTFHVIDGAQPPDRVAADLALAI